MYWQHSILILSTVVSFLIVGIIVSQYSQWKGNEIEKYFQKPINKMTPNMSIITRCCRCWNYSVSDDVKVDWTYCESFNSNNTFWTRFFKFFFFKKKNKKNTIHNVWILLLGYNISILGINNNYWDNIRKTCSFPLWIFNILISFQCCYALFRSLEYKETNIDNDFICYVDVVWKYTAVETLLTVVWVCLFAYFTFPFVMLPFQLAFRQKMCYQKFTICLYKWILRTVPIVAVSALVILIYAMGLREKSTTPGELFTVVLVYILCFINWFSILCCPFFYDRLCLFYKRKVSSKNTEEKRPLRGDVELNVSIR
ncbi:hypothetical protein RFI_35030 [Reticulomyxa filosa]|uniref:Uncharacterized protein n=1 Tax=Reticulomyxa filosa TaxID=46433 RepID=X6LNX6_RETFI|nr:hypothetical protein RFI_35030 [Reticulomyxa filosa]|eukprot:ETO02405.1 hypothetical protein RFI_35030 [Reticulomyxa filosa]